VRNDERLGEQRSRPRTRFASAPTRRPGDPCSAFFSQGNRAAARLFLLDDAHRVVSLVIEVDEQEVRRDAAETSAGAAGK
jgi:hypothetical protein